MVEKITQKGILYESPEGEKRLFYSARDAMFKLDFEYRSRKIRGLAWSRRNGFREVTRVYRVETRKGEVLVGVFNSGCSSLEPFDKSKKKVYIRDIVNIEDITLAHDL